MSTDKRSSSRTASVKVRTAKGRRLSSTLWLQRQLNDPYVQKARKEGYRSRAAYKLIELDEKFHFLKPGQCVIDLGAAPGGWTQVAVERTHATDEKARKKGVVVGIDLLEISPIGGAALLQNDFMDDAVPELIKAAAGGPADIVLSDMAPNTTGHPGTDHLRIMGLCEAAFEFACQVLKPEGVFVAKVFQGGAEKELLIQMKQRFKVVKHAKPKASRADSSEMYVVATGYRPA